jgi:TonB family protein
MIISSLLASAVVATTPATPLPWFDLDDYPVKAFERELQGVTTFAVIVGPDGRAADCQVTKSSGHDILDRQACWVAKHARFTPAYGSDGRPTFGVYRSQVVWARPDRNLNMQRDLGPDLEVSVNQLPPGMSQPLAVKVAYFVDPAGNPSACTPLPDSKGQPAQLIDVACQALFQQLPRQAVTADGNAVAAVKTAAVRITASK